MNCDMQKPKPPVKFDIELTSIRKKNIHGTAIFHEKEFKISIKPEENVQVMKIPFKILGIMDEICSHMKPKYSEKWDPESIK